jgi:hypothetical protein
MMDHYHYWLILSAVYAAPQCSKAAGAVLSMAALVVAVFVWFVK